MPTARTAIPTLLALAACASGPAEITRPAVPYTATRALSPRGTTEVTIRTARRVPGGTTELTDLPCTLRAEGFHASFTTPARVTVPNLPQRMPPATVTCTRGTTTTSARLEPWNRTVSEAHQAAQARQSGSDDFMGLGAITAALVTGLGLSGRDRSRDVWSYRDVTVILEP